MNAIRLEIGPEWRMVEAREDGAAFVHRAKTLFVICSVGVEADGRRWRHVSMSYRNRLPSYEDLKLVKDAFIGADRWAVQVFPKASEHVNIMPFCLHLWSCEEQGILPDFTQGSGSI